MHSHDPSGRGEHRHGHGRGRRGFLGRFGGFMGGPAFRPTRMLGSEDLQLIILALLSEKPRHGYELIKAFEEQSSGLYVPSPGVIYPALTYLEETGYAVSETVGNKKLYSVTDSGKEHLTRNQGLVDETLEQLSRFGRKMARVQRHFADEEDENELDESEPRSDGRKEWRRMKFEFRELIGEFKMALREKLDAPTDEKKRVLEILRKALAEIGKKSPEKAA